MRRITMPHQGVLTTNRVDRRRPRLRSCTVFPKNTARYFHARVAQPPPAVALGARRQVSGHGFIRAVTSLLIPCHPDRPRASFASKREWKDPDADSHHHAASGSSLGNIFHSAMQITLSIASTLPSADRREIIEPTLKASARRSRKGWVSLNKSSFLAPQAARSEAERGFWNACRAEQQPVKAGTSHHCATKTRLRNRGRADT
jgi:hypothetical protein